MYKPEGLKFSEKKELTLSNDVPNTVAVFFLILETVFGMNFGFTKWFDDKTQPIARTISILASLMVFCILCIPVVLSYVKDSLFDYWFSIAVVQYASLFIILNLTKYKMYDFIQDITSIRDDITELRREIIGVAAFVYSLMIFLIKFGIGFAHCIDMGDEKCLEIYKVPYYVYAPTSLILDTTSVIVLIIYYYLYCCARKLKMIAKKIDVNVMEIEKFYLNLAECYDKMIPLNDRLITVELLFEIPKLMGMVFWMLTLIKIEATWVQIITEAVYSCHIFIRILIPAIIAEMVNHEVGCTTRALNYLLVKEEDAKKSAKLLGLLRYMGAVRLQHRIGCVVPVDMRLPLSVLSLSVTYLIVIVQFTHLYD